MQLFGTKGQKLLLCPGTKGRRDNLKILPRDGTGPDSQNSGRDGPGEPKTGTEHRTKQDRTEGFVPGHLLLPLSRDKGTPGQENFFVPGQMDDGKSRPGLSQDVPSLGNPTFDCRYCSQK